MRILTRIKSFYRRRCRFCGALSSLIALVVLLLPPHSKADVFFGVVFAYTLICWGYEYRTSRLKRLLKVSEYKRLRAKKAHLQDLLMVCKLVDAELSHLSRYANVPSETTGEYANIIVDTIYEMSKKA